MGLLQPHIEENYNRIVASGDRSYEDLAIQGDREGSPALAAWARAKAAEEGIDVTPREQGPAEKTYADMLVKDLKAIAEKRDDVTPAAGWLRNDYVEALEAADKVKSTLSTEGVYDGIPDGDILIAAETRELDITGDRADIIARLLADDEAKSQA